MSLNFNFPVVWIHYNYLGVSFLFFQMIFKRKSVSISDDLFVSTACTKQSGFWFFRHPLSSSLYAIFWLTCHLHVFPLLPQGFCLWTSPILSSLRFFYPRPDSFSVLPTSFHRALPVNMVLTLASRALAGSFWFCEKKGRDWWTCGFCSTFSFWNTSNNVDSLSYSKVQGAILMPLMPPQSLWNKTRLQICWVMFSQSLSSEECVDSVLIHWSRWALGSYFQCSRSFPAVFLQVHRDFTHHFTDFFSFMSEHFLCLLLAWYWHRY